MTVARWRTQNWRSLQHEPRHPLEIARAVDERPVLTGDPISTAEPVPARGNFLVNLLAQRRSLGEDRQMAMLLAGIGKSAINTPAGQ